MATGRDLFDPTDPTGLTPEQRLTGIAAILAAGLVRMRERRRATATGNGGARPGRTRGTAASDRRTLAYTSEISPESGETRLELSHRSSPDGQRG